MNVLPSAAIFAQAAVKVNRVSSPYPAPFTEGELRDRNGSFLAFVRARNLFAD